MKEKYHMRGSSKHIMLVAILELQLLVQCSLQQGRDYLVFSS